MSAATRFKCRVMGRGHNPNPTAVRRSAGAPRRPGRLAAVEGTLITVLLAPGEVLHARNHDTERLLRIVREGGVVDVPIAFPGLLRTYEGYQFSILSGGEELEPCTDDPFGWKVQPAEDRQ